MVKEVGKSHPPDPKHYPKKSIPSWRFCWWGACSVQKPITIVKCALFIATQNGKLKDDCKDIWHIQTQDENSSQSSGWEAEWCTAQLCSAWATWLCGEHTERCTRTIYQSIHLFVYLCIYICTSYLSNYLSKYLFIHLSISTSTYLSFFLSIHPSIYLSICQSRKIVNWGTFAKRETVSAAQCSQFP